MKLLFVTNALEIGGIETNLVRLTRALTERGHTVLAATGAGALVSDFQAAGGDHHQLDRPITPRRALRASREIEGIVESESPDVVHSFSASGELALWLYLIRANFRRRQVPPVVSSIMGLKNAPDESVVKTYARAFLTTLGANRIIIISPAIEKTVQRLPVRRRRLVALKLVGLSDERATPQDRRVSKEERRRFLGVNDDGRIVLTIGNLEPRKSHELFIRAAARALDQVPDAHFLIVGDGSLRDRLRAEIPPSKRDRIRLVGGHKEAALLLEAADVYVRPAVVEGFVGLTVLEAQAAGVPVVSFETEDVKLAICDRETGILVPARNTDLLADAVVELLTNGSLARRLSENAKRQFEQEWSLSSVVTHLESFYASLLPSIPQRQAS